MRGTVGTTAPARNFARGRCRAWLWLLALAPLPLAAAVVAPYQAVVPLQGTAEADRAAAIGEALKTAAVRASGQPEAASAPRIVAAAADPSGFVQQYATTADRQLRVGFDARAMDQLLQQAGLPSWPAERPAVTVLLFTPGVAGGARAVTAADRGPERAEVERAAEARGVPVSWPAESLDVATARSRLATEGATLLGVGGGATYEWVFAHAGQTARGQGALSQGPDLAADTLAARYAPASTRTVSTVRLRVGGLQRVRDYAALTQYLEGLSLVRGVVVRELQRDTVQFELQVRGDLELLRRIFALDGRLQPASSPVGAAAATVDFTWQS